MSLYDKLVGELQALSGTDWTPDAQLSDAAYSFCLEAEAFLEKSEKALRHVILEAANNKLDCGKPIYRKIADKAFHEGVVLNYWDKLDIQNFVNARDRRGFERLLVEKGVDAKAFEESFREIPDHVTIAALSGLRGSDVKWKEVLSSIFARATFMSAGKSFARSYFANTEHTGPRESFFSYVDELYPGRVKRELGLSIIEVDGSLFGEDYENACNRTLEAVKEAYEKLGNHTELCVLIPPIYKEEDLQWRLFSDVVLYAEKGILEEIDRMYFRKKIIREVTEAYINGVNDPAARFNLAATGFVFKDCFSISIAECGGDSWLMLVLEKNVRDERPVPCPACYTLNVEGNSYPILNVRSWECRNPLCPDRSKYNRGKRYALNSMVRQSHIGNDADMISRESIAKWHLDCIELERVSEIYDMMIHHYSFAGDRVLLFGSRKYVDESRVLDYSAFPKYTTDLLQSFKNGPYFERYEHDAPASKENELITRFQIGDATIVNSESRSYLSTLIEGSIDCVVTSPPYYNAKDYSQWANIYCYLYDMRNIAKEVFRVLKLGGVFLYNVFDYFDNERNVVFSAMGDKRMILGAYAIDSFRRLGFKLQGNIVWCKGEIQGNRSFNQGNESPYYQSPLNCWEHILVFSKGDPSPEFASLKSRTEFFRPFIKMVRGKNVLGHDAPFPEDIPNLVVDLMSKDQIVLDPFGGSCTTALAASRKGIKSICVEQKREYCEIGKERIKKLQRLL